MIPLITVRSFARAKPLERGGALCWTQQNTYGENPSLQLHGSIQNQDGIRGKFTRVGFRIASQQDTNCRYVLV